MSFSPRERVSDLGILASSRTKTGLFKDERDTLKRRTRHRDGRLLRGGIGLTTGLGWSDRYVNASRPSFPHPNAHTYAHIVRTRIRLHHLLVDSHPWPSRGHHPSLL